MRAIPRSNGDFGNSDDFFDRHQFSGTVGPLDFTFTMAVGASVVAALGNRNPKVKEGSAAVVC